MSQVICLSFFFFKTAGKCAEKEDEGYVSIANCLLVVNEKCAIQ